MNILDGIRNFLQYINDNWTAITVIIGLLIMVYRKITAYISKDNDEKIAIAKEIVLNKMLDYVSNAEMEYSDWVKAGAAKRAQVIGRIYAEYPVLAKVADQEGLIAWIDEVIKSALKEMREMVSSKVE